MTTKIELKPNIISALPAAPHGKRAYAWDALVPGFCVRVTDKGAKSFCLSAKLPGKSNTEILTIGAVGKFTLADARDVARDWLIQISRGTDPRQAKIDAAKKVDDAGKNCFRARATQWQAIGLSHVGERSLVFIAHSMTKRFIPVWGDRPVDSLTTKEIADLIKNIAQDHGTGAARIALSHIKQFYNWLANDGTVPFSPCAAISGKTLLGEAPARERVLTDAELAAVWHGAWKLDLWLPQIYRLLILTGCRRDEVSRARWEEIDLKEKVWVIPAKRMKGKQTHVIPLTPMMIEIIMTIPRSGSPLLFPSRNGTAAKLDNRARAKITKACGFSDWVNHDLRRTMRTGLSPKAMGIPFEIAERMVAHTQNKLVRAYDKFEYLEEKRAGFEAWCNYVAGVARRHDANPVKRRAA